MRWVLEMMWRVMCIKVFWEDVAICNRGAKVEVMECGVDSGMYRKVTWALKRDATWA